MPIILTDLEYRKAFDLFHIFKSKGYELIGFSSENLLSRFLLSLIYRQKIHHLPKDDDFAFALKQGVKEKNATYFPIEEDTTLLFYENRSSLLNISSLLPSEEAFKLVRDKKFFSQFCQQHTLPIPKEYHYQQLITENKLPSPLIIKPRIGSGSMGIKFVDTIEVLKTYHTLDFENYIIQERLPNSRDIEGGFFLYQNSKLVTYYGHKRLRTYPPEGGVTVYSKCEMKEELKTLGDQLLSTLNWSGIAMVEFLFDPKTQSYKIIEVNPRAWGSIMLSEYCNSYMLENFLLATNNMPIVQTDIKQETYIRWFFPWDLLTYIQQKGLIKNFWQFNSKQCCFINFSYAPKVSAIAFTLYNLFNPKKISKFFRKVFT